MAQSWHEDLPEDTFTSEADRKYMIEINRIREGLASGLGFDDACTAVEEKDEGIRGLIIDDALKIVIAGEHFSKGVSLEEIAARLKLPVERLKAAKDSMLEEIVIEGTVGMFPSGMDH